MSTIRDRGPIRGYLVARRAESKDFRFAMRAFSSQQSSQHPLRRRCLLALVVVVLLLPAIAAPSGAHSVPDTGDPTPSDGEGDGENEPPPPVVRSITFPVVGPTNYSDTWGACRGYRCSRSHKGADIFGAKLAPLVAAADGRIVSVRRTALTSAGNKVVIEDDDGWRYYYFHLNNDSPGTDDAANPQAWIIPGRLRVGDRVTAGQIIGYLGDSGNAERTPNHLHFEVHQPGVGAINPTASLERAQAEGRVVPVDTLASTSEGRSEHGSLIVSWYRALLKRDPSASELFAWADRFAIGLAARNDLIADLTMAPQRYGPAGTVLRAHYVALGRRPDITELRAAEERYRSGVDTIGIVGGILEGSTFRDRHGSLTDAEFIEVIYRNARGRAPSSSVRAYWAKQLGEGRSRADMAAYFVDSYGLKSNTWHELEVQQAFRAALDRLATDVEHDRWVAHLDRGGLIIDVVDGIRS